jgi:hypothetical protein
MARALEVDFPPERKAKDSYDLETTGEIFRKLFGDDEVDPEHIAEVKRIMGINPEALPYARLAEVYAIGSEEEEKMAPHLSCEINRVQCKALCDIGAQVSVLSSKIYNKVQDCNLDLAPTSTELIMGDGRTIRTLGIACNMNVKIVGDSPRGPLKQRGNSHLKPATKPKHNLPNHAGNSPLRRPIKAALLEIPSNRLRLARG